MKKYIVFIALLFLAACTPKQVLDEPPLHYSMLPKFADLNSVNVIKQDDTNSVVDASYKDFKSIPLDSGKLVTINKDTLRIPGGVLISDRKAALYVYYKAGWERYQKELDVSRTLTRQYYDYAANAEKLYQDEIVRLRKKEQRSWLEKNMGYIGFAAGILVGVINDFVIMKIVK